MEILQFNRDEILKRAKEVRNKIEQAATFIPDEASIEYSSLFPTFNPYGHQYKTGDRFRYKGELYKVLQEHTSQGDWPPDKAVSLYVRIADPAEEWPEWVQPLGAHDAYPQGAKVSHQGKHWVSEIDANTYEPGVYGWAEQQ